ncbi:hypothetical protein ACFFV7_50865 [Nonomuraea spiralis]|uniref:Uncharacterized protein n=1 Tax=Nonomuraea spiralis TaxID=46182 RepID=A0ABV5IYF0_9ACTN|nr:hypothetical protein [Nonomuraea spiralis]GGS88633.1 hypothetical protein GCM10010176_035530 [Nonomuraea spiralis]
MELAIITLTLLVIYLVWDHYRHPKKACPRCVGSGRKTSRWNGKAYGLCRRCRGKGEVRR